MTNCSQIEFSSESERSTDSGSQSSDTKSSSESILSLIKGPFIPNPISFIDDELKKVFDFNRIQSKLAEKYNQLSTSIISTFDSQILPNSDKNVFITPEYENTINECIDANTTPVKEDSEVLSPLVVSRKGKRKTRANGSEASESDGTIPIDNVEDNPHIITSELHTKNSIQISENNETNEDNRLEMILSAYKEANNIVDINETEEIDNFRLECEDITNGVLNYENPSEGDIITENDDSVELRVKEQTEKSINKSSVDEINEKRKTLLWQQLDRVKSNSVLEFSAFCANGYNSDSDVGLIWFLSKDRNTLLYYPSFEYLKVSKGKALAITCATYELFVLTETGLIFKREGMDATKPIGTKWTQIKSNRSKFKITSISFNWKDSILWCCDANGETWTLEMYGQKWTLIKDFSSHSIEMRKVSVSPNDCRIVWGIDKNGSVFVRYFKPSDKNNQFCGDQWLLMDGILATDIVVCCDNSVLIVVRKEGIFRRSAIVSDDDKLDEWQPIVGPDLNQTDSFVSVSVTENSEIMAMTEEGSVWHTFGLPKRQSTREDLDWLII